MAGDCFYEDDGEGRFHATELTRGPWDPGAQHAGPPAALLGRRLEQLEDAAAFHLGRISFEILRSVPIGPVRLAARVVRPGRRVQLAEATLADDDGEVLMRAAAWRIRKSSLDLSGAALPAPDPPPPVETGGKKAFFGTGESVGYHSAMEARFVAGAFLESGPAQVWMRMRHPLVGGEEPTPLQRTLIAADVGNGVSATLDWSRFLFINVDLTVHLERLPEGEWVFLDAVTLAQPHGTGTSESVLKDERGRIGRALQTLLIAER